MIVHWLAPLLKWVWILSYNLKTFWTESVTNMDDENQEVPKEVDIDAEAQREETAEAFLDGDAPIPDEEDAGEEEEKE